MRRNATRRGRLAVFAQKLIRAGAIAKIALVLLYNFRESMLFEGSRKRRDRQPCQAKRSLSFRPAHHPMRLGLRGQSLGHSSIDSELALSVKARSLLWRTTMPRQITCITKPDVHSSHEAITHVGGSSFYVTREQCADDIRFRRESYFVHVGLYQTSVEAYQRNNTGPWFIRTKQDNTQKDNLLSLLQCRR
jgi:hypothetical protein